MFSFFPEVCTNPLPWNVFRHKIGMRRWLWHFTPSTNKRMPDVPGLHLCLNYRQTEAEAAKSWERRCLLIYRAQEPCTDASSAPKLLIFQQRLSFLHHQQQQQRQQWHQQLQQQQNGDAIIQGLGPQDHHLWRPQWSQIAKPKELILD